MKRFEKSHIPNYISAFRIILIPLYVLFFFGVIAPLRVSAMTAAGYVFILAGLSDAIDGYLARKNGWITDIGKLLDPLADKLLELVVALSFSIKFGGPFIILASIIITKEVIMIIGAYLIMSKSSVYVSSVWCGKLATIMWYALLLVVHFFPDTASSTALSYVLCIVLVLVMIMAFVMYIYNYASQIKSTKDAILNDKKNS